MTRYGDYVKEKDVQMLAMLSMLVLQTELGANIAPGMRVKNTTSITALTSRLASVDYFSLTKTPVNISGPNSPEWPSSPVAPSITPSFSSNSSRGSWSSLFNTGTVRQFMNGVQGSLKEGLSTPTEIIHSHGMSRSTEKLRPTGSELAVGELPKRRMRQDSLLHAQVPTVISGVQQPFKSGSFSSAAGHRHLRFTDSSSFTNENQVVIFEPDRHEDT